MRVEGFWGTHPRPDFVDDGTLLRACFADRETFEAVAVVILLWEADGKRDVDATRRAIAAIALERPESGGSLEGAPSGV